jgi:hypothetical protein
MIDFDLVHIDNLVVLSLLPLFTLHPEVVQGICQVGVDADPLGDAAT